MVHGVREQKLEVVDEGHAGDAAEMGSVAVQQEGGELVAHAALGAPLHAVAPQERELEPEPRQVHVDLPWKLLYLYS